MTRAHDQQGDLLPCPFCGGKAAIWRRIAGRATVGCDADRFQCGVQPSTVGDMAEAIAAWNRRALSPPMTSPADPDWPIATDGPNKVGEQRRWLARKLMDSSLTDAEAFSVVAFHGDIKDAAQTSPAAGAVERLQEALRPFAEYAAYIDDGETFSADSEIVSVLSGGIRRSIRFRDLRAAVSALSLVGGNPKP